jgi:hypothetical protein
MRPYAVPGRMKVFLAASDVERARRIVEDFVNDTA